MWLPNFFTMEFYKGHVAAPKLFYHGILRWSCCGFHIFLPWNLQRNYRQSILAKSEVQTKYNKKEHFITVCVALIAKIIRIYQREGRIEKSLPRIAVWHHEAC